MVPSSFSREILGLFFDKRASIGRRNRGWKSSFSSQGFQLTITRDFDLFSLRTVINCDLGFGILVVSRIKLKPSHVHRILVEHDSQSLSERERDFSMMIPIFFF